MFFPAVCHNILEFSSRVLVVGRSRYSTAKFPTRFHQRAKREIIGTCPRPHEVNADMTIVSDGKDRMLKVWDAESGLARYGVKVA